MKRRFSRPYECLCRRCSSRWASRGRSRLGLEAGTGFRGPQLAGVQRLATAYEGIADMLVLSRKKNESIIINDDITIVVVEIRGDKVRLGIEAPKEIPVHRNEVYEAIRRSEQQGQEADASNSAE